MKLSKIMTLLGVVVFALFMGIATPRAEDKPDGLAIFKSKCTMCHGVDGKGFKALKTPDFTDPKWQAAAKDNEILNVIKNGKKDTAMPAFADKLSEKEILALVRQVRAFGRK
ncbi:MAG: c-type cytochrome [Deltaproteobacteria bacterium]